MHRSEFIQLLGRYRTRFMEETAMVTQTIDFVRHHESCFDRTQWDGHVTGSAWVVNPRRDHALLLHHKKLDMWLQPGGHADGDNDIHRVVIKETAEETGIDMDNIRLVSEEVFDVDVHVVYESAHDQRHKHFDVRFLLEIDDQLPIPGNNESHEIRWVPLYQVRHYNNALSLHRLVLKTQALHN